VQYERKSIRKCRREWKLAQDFGRKSGEVTLGNGSSDLVWRDADFEKGLEEGASRLAG